jgi:hypothetical protein
MPKPVNEVPASIPRGGVSIADTIVLMPPAHAAGLISAGRAVVIAAGSAGVRVWQRPRAIRATVPGPISVGPDAGHSTWLTLRNVPVWVVTFTAKTPQHVGQGPFPTAAVRHFSVVLDARDGRFIRGFYTA